MQNHSDNTIKTSGHSSLEKYTSHFIERVVCERELETEQRLQHIDLHSYAHNCVSFLFSWAAQPGVWRPSLCWDMFSFHHLHSNWLTSCLHLGYIIVQCPPSSCERHKSHSIQPVHGQGYILIFLNQMHLLFTQVHFLFWQLGRVGGQYATVQQL